MKKLLIFLLLLAAAAAGAWYFRDRFTTAEGPLRLYGNVDIRGVDLGFRVAGRLQEVLKDEGDAVSAGELLARLDAQPYLDELARADAQVAAAEADQRLKKSGNRSEEIAQGRAALEESRVVAKNAARTHQRHAGLVGGGATSQLDLENSEAALDEASQRVLLNEAKLKLLEAGFRAEFTPKSVETHELRTSLVSRLRIVVDDSDGSLRQGMPVTVSLEQTPR